MLKGGPSEDEFDFRGGIQKSEFSIEGEAECFFKVMKNEIDIIITIYNDKIPARGIFFEIFFLFSAIR